MGSYANEKRARGRMKREFAVSVKTGKDTKLVYTIDLSHGGVKVGGALLKLPVGEQVEILMEQVAEKIPFAGRVAREDGICHLNRIGRDANTFFIRIADARFSEFVSSNYHL